MKSGGKGKAKNFNVGKEDFKRQGTEKINIAFDSSFEDEKTKTYQTPLTSQRTSSQLQCLFQRHCSTLPVRKYAKLKLF